MSLVCPSADANNSDLPDPVVRSPAHRRHLPAVHPGVERHGAVCYGLLPDDHDVVPVNRRLPDLRRLRRPHAVDHVHDGLRWHSYDYS